ncbi:hypothetical protein FIBSPDRAFT_955046 [Athelia psychrophila]|uniref:Major facilitator superfamily (MFS) profile domain-containing protein n=1 Tax=Athelia psychrophila TaxID=1759441 RepID=A0A166IMS2_9AGAM|nr:hypothetical protein FIBSPDRAFT_955046 [Fibularhizoctonia sp. CBS 109695]
MSAVDEKASEDKQIESASVLDVNENLAAKIKNPLYGIPRDRLIRNVEAFAAEKDLTDILPHLQKGAVLAQNPADFESLSELDSTDKDVIRHERGHKWSHPLTLYITVFLCSIGAATQGWDQTGSNGANLSFPLEFGIPTTPGTPNAAANSWLVGVINAAPYLSSALLGCWLSDPLNNYLGRRGTIFICALILIATPIASAFTHSWQTLLIVRLVLGIGMGAKGATVPMFAAENSPAQIRGALVMGWQLWTAFGLFLGYAANMAWEYSERFKFKMMASGASIEQEYVFPNSDNHGSIRASFLFSVATSSPPWLTMRRCLYDGCTCVIIISSCVIDQDHYVAQTSHLRPLTRKQTDKVPDIIWSADNNSLIWRALGARDTRKP